MQKRIIKYGGAVCGPEERRALIKSIDKSIISRNWQQAEEGDLLEKECAKYLNVKYGILTNSGSSAGLLALSSLELPRGSEVIISAVTFPTIFNIIIQCGLVPVVVDAKVGTYGFDVKEVEGAITPKTKAIIAIHPLGNPVDMPALMKLTKKHEKKGQKIWVIEDNCLAEGTLIKIAKKCPNCADMVVGCIRCGNTRKISIDVPIEKVAIEDEVLTRKGYRRVLRTIYRGEKEVITKLGITATPDHPVITKLGIKGLADLQPSDIIYKWNEKQLSIKEESIIGIQNQIGDKLGYTSTHTNRINLLSHFIDNFGLITLGKYLRKWLSTTKTKIRSIMNFQTWNSCPSQNIHLSTQVSQNILNWCEKISSSHRQKPQNGTPRWMDESGIASMVERYGKSEDNPLRLVNYVESNIKPIGQRPQGSAIEDVSRKVAVYDLEVENEHEFFANNILVHNCDGFGGGIEI